MKTIASFCFILITLNQSVFSQTCESQRYKQPVFSQLNVTRDVVYGTAEALSIVYINENTTRTIDLTLDLFQPRGDTLKKRPLMIWAYGGGYLVGTKEDADVQVLCDSFAHRGFVTASINYRMGVNVLDSVSAERAVYRSTQDFSAAVRYFKEWADYYKIDTNQIFIAGNSAGSLAALHMSLLDEDDRPASSFADSIGLVTMPDLGCADCSGNNYNHSRNVRAVINCWGAIADTAWMDAGEAKPVISFHGDADITVPFSEGKPFSTFLNLSTVHGSSYIHRRLLNLGAYSEFYPLYGQGHIPWGMVVNNQWAVGSPTPYFDTIYQHIVDFTIEQLKPEPKIIFGLEDVCIGDTALYVIDNPLNSTFCVGVTGGTIVNSNSNADSLWIKWQNTGTIEVKEQTEYGAIGNVFYKNIVINSLPDIQLANNNIQICRGNDIEIFVSNTPGYSYQWQSTSGEYVDSIGNPIVSPDTTTQYTVTISNHNQCFVDTTINVIVNPLPEIPVIQQNDDKLSVISIDSIQWFYEGGAILNGNTLILQPYFDGNYSVKSFNSFNCSALSEPYYYEKEEINTSIELRNGLNDVIILQSPFHNQLVVKCSKTYNYKLIDLTGKTVLSGVTVAGYNIIATAHLPSGTYFFTIKNKPQVKHYTIYKY